MGDAYCVENTRLREIGQKLSPLRDAAALIETFDELKIRNEIWPSGRAENN